MAADESAPLDENRRRHERVPLTLLVQYRLNSFEDFLAEYSADISAGGMFIRTDAPREEGAMIYLQFWLNDGSKLIEGLGRVVRVNPPGVEGRVPGMGVEFVNFDEDSMSLIAEIVASRASRRARG